MFIAALFTIARIWKQSRCPSADERIRKLWYIYTMEYYSAIKKNVPESVLMRWMKLEPIVHSEVSQKEKYQYSILTHIYGIFKDGNDDPICETAKETQIWRTDFWTLGEGEGRMIWENSIETCTLPYVKEITSPSSMHETGRSNPVHWDHPKDGMWREVEGSSGWGKHVHPWLIHVHVWQKPPQYCKVISLQLK